MGYVEKEGMASHFFNGINDVDGDTACRSSEELLVRYLLFRESVDIHSSKAAFPLEIVNIPWILCMKMWMMRITCSILQFKKIFTGG